MVLDIHSHTPELLDVEVELGDGHVEALVTLALLQGGRDVP